MSSCFGSYRTNNTSKDYTNKLRNKAIYSDLQNNTKTKNRKIACVNQSGNLSKVNNHSNLLNLMHGFVDCKGTEISKLGQQFSKIKCEIYNDITSNTDISNGYTGTILTTDTPGFLSDTFEVINTGGAIINRYAEIVEGTSDSVVLANNQKYNKTKCYDRNMKINVTV